MDIVQAIRVGEGKAIYADGDHEASMKLNGKNEEGHLFWDIFEHTKGVGHLSGVNLTPREALTILDERGIQLDAGWHPDWRHRQA
jgi:hypothetical protein